jgi:hypothetical protein
MSQHQKKTIKLTRSDDDDGAEESDLGVRQPEVVDPLRQLEHRVHQELGVARRHLLNRLLADDVAVQADEALKFKKNISKTLKYTQL